MALQEVHADRSLQAAYGEAAGSDADGASCFQGAEFRPDVDRLVDVTDQGGW